MKPMDELTVVEVRGSAAGGYAGRLFAGWGAPVTLATLADTAQSQRPDDEALDRFLDHAKHRVDVDKAGLEELAVTADVVIESSSPDPLAARVEEHPGLVNVRISPLGRSGPDGGLWSTELTDQARSGHLLLNGDPDREPIAGPPFQVPFAAGLHGFIGATAALYGSNHQAGCTVEVSHLQVMASLHQFTLIRRLNGGTILRRMGNRWAGPGDPCGIYACRDGFVSIIVPRDDQLERLLAVADLLHLVDEPGIAHLYDLMHHPTLLDEHLRPWFATRELGPLVELLQAVRVPAAPVSTMADLLTNPHLTARSSLIEVDGLQLPGPPARIDGAPWQVTPAATRSHPTTRAPAPAVGGADPTRPLEGVRIVDLSRVWAGPLATRILADLGADVVMVEAPWARGGPTIDEASVRATGFYPNNDPGDEHYNRTGFVNKYALGKRSIALDLSHSPATDALAALLSTADVVIENFSPRVMPQLGFDEDRLRELNPDLVYVTMPGYGRSGPDRDRVAYGPIVDAHAGLATLMGYEGEPARSAGVAWPDPVAGMHAAAATLVALINRAAGRPAGTAEVAQFEATISMVGPELVRYQLEGRLPVASGNQHRYWPLQAVVKCQGDDRWVAVSVVDERGLRHLTDVVLNEPDSAPGIDDLESELGRWAAGRPQEEVVTALSAHGLAVAAVADAQQVLEDPQLAASDAWVRTDHPAAGTETWPRTAITINGEPQGAARPAPLLGEHNRVLAVEAGLTPLDYDHLVSAGLLATVPPD